MPRLPLPVELRAEAVDDRWDIERQPATAEKSNLELGTMNSVEEPHDQAPSALAMSNTDHAEVKEDPILDVVLNILLKSYGLGVLGVCTGISSAYLRGEPLHFRGSSFGTNFGMVGLSFFSCYDVLMKTMGVEPVVASAGAGGLTSGLWGAIVGGRRQGMKGLIFGAGISTLGSLSYEAFQSWKRKKGRERYQAKYHPTTLQHPVPRSLLSLFSIRDENVNHERTEAEHKAVKEDQFARISDFIWPSSWLPLYSETPLEKEEKIQKRMQEIQQQNLSKP